MYKNTFVNDSKEAAMPNNASLVCWEDWEVFSLLNKTSMEWDFIEECFEAYQEGENKITLPCLHEEAVAFADFCYDCAQANDERMN